VIGGSKTMTMGCWAKGETRSQVNSGIGVALNTELRTQRIEETLVS